MTPPTVLRLSAPAWDDLFMMPEDSFARAADPTSRQKSEIETRTYAGIVDYLHQLLADTLTLRNMYATPRRGSGAGAERLNQLFGVHYAGQHELVDQIAERIRLLGGFMIARPQDIAAATLIPRRPRKRETLPAQITRFLEAHQTILVVARAMRPQASKHGEAPDDQIVANLVRTNEMHAMQLFLFMAQVVPRPSSPPFTGNDHASPESGLL